MEENVRNAVFGNVGTIVAFRVGPLDAELLEKIFAPQFTVEDLVNLGFAQIYLTLMIDGVGSPPFSAVTMPLIEPPGVSHKDRILARSRERYGAPRERVEEEIRKLHEPEPGFAEAEKEAKRPRRVPPRPAAPAPEETRPAVSSSLPRPAPPRAAPERLSPPASRPRPEHGGRPRRPAPPRPISLHELKRAGKEAMERGKGPREESRAELRSALAAVLANSSPAPAPREEAPAPRTPVPGEVPEDVLRKLIDGESRP